MTSIITINYNSTDKTIGLLNSLRNQTDRNFNIYVVDNASDQENIDALINYISSTSLEVKLIKSAENLGFGAGNNLGLEISFKNGSEWAILLNPDITLESDFMAKLRPYLASNGDIIAIPLQEDSGRVAFAGIVSWLRPTLEHDYDNRQENIFAIGGGMAFSKNCFLKTSGFDPKYFLYFEDADLSIRSKELGFSIKTLDQPVAKHQTSSVTKKLGSPLLLRYHYRNALYFNLKNGPWYIKILVWPWSWVIMLKQIIKLAAGRNIGQSQAILYGVVDWYKNKMGKI